jgi:hypothetical protein
MSLINPFFKIITTSSSQQLVGVTTDELEAVEKLSEKVQAVSRNLLAFSIAAALALAPFSPPAALVAFGITCAILATERMATYTIAQTKDNKWADTMRDRDKSVPPQKVTLIESSVLSVAPIDKKWEKLLLAKMLAKRNKARLPPT